MSAPINAILTGTYTATAAAKTLSLPSGYTKFELYNTTDLADASSTEVFYAVGTSAMPAGGALYSIGNGGSSVLAPKYTSTQGFTFVSDSAGTANGGYVALSGTEINRANPAVASTGSTTGLVDTVSVVRLKGTTGMLQVSGMDFTVGTIVTDTSFQLKYLNNSGFAADATSGSYQIINADPRFYPRRRFITAITTGASSTEIRMSVTHGLTVGQAVRIICPAAFGMVEINNLIGTITAINVTLTNSITVDIPSSSFTAFAFPTSATAAAGVTFAQVVPVGEAAINSPSQPYGNLLDDATDNTSYTGVVIGTTVQTSGATYQWIASKGLSI